MQNPTPNQPEARRRTFASDFRMFFVRGLAVLLPTVLTIWLLLAAYQFVEGRIAQPINAGIRQLVIFTAPRVLPPSDFPPWFTVNDDQVRAARVERERLGQLPLADEALRAHIRASNLREWWEARWHLRAIGLVTAVILFYVAGVVLGGLLGRSLYERFEARLTRVPIFKQVYPSVKQVVDFLFGQRQIAFNRVVLIEYPRRGIWSVGLVTGPAMRGTEAVIGEECVTVFVPSSPTPFTGWTVTVPKEDVRDLPVSIDEAMKFIVSGGVLAPTGVRPGVAPLEADVRHGVPGPARPDPISNQGIPASSRLASGPSAAKMTLGPGAAPGDPLDHPPGA